jgi:thiol:disulfide interchange protein
VTARASSAVFGLALLALAVLLLSRIGSAPVPSLVVSAALGAGSASLSFLGRAVRRS